MSTSTYTITARIEVEIRDGIPLDRALSEIGREIAEIGRRPWPEEDADWRVGHESNAVAVAYENVGTALASERGQVAGPEPHLVTTHEGRTIDARNNIPAETTGEKR